MSGAEHRRASAFIGGYKQLRLFHFLCRLKPELHARSAIRNHLSNLGSVAMKRAPLATHSPTWNGSLGISLNGPPTPTVASIPLGQRSRSACRISVRFFKHSAIGVRQP